MAYSREEAAELIIKAGYALVEKGLIARTWGNISARLSDTEFLVTPSGMGYDRLTPDKLVVCKISDCSYEGEIKPSSEKGVHGEAYKYRPDVNFVIHTHQLYATAVGTTGKSLSARTAEEEKILGADVISAKYAISSTRHLMRNVSDAIQKNTASNAFFMRYHGVLCLGRDYDHAFAVSETLEDICKDIICRKDRLIVDEIRMTDPGTIAQSLGISLDDLQALVDKTGKKSLLLDTSKVVEDIAGTETKIYPMIDDMAQIAGVRFLCLAPADGTFLTKAESQLQKKTCVFIRGIGALCLASDPEEAEAVAMVLEKNCLAYAYGRRQGEYAHLGLLDAALQRNTYVKKYSKLK